MRQFNNRAAYYACIVESARDALRIDPEDRLHRQVNANISGGHMMWDDDADELFGSPKTLEEGLLALELRTVLEAAVENQLKAVRVLSRSGQVNFDIFGFPMDFGILLGSAPKLAKRNVLTAMRVKIEMSAIAHKTDDCSLSDFLGRHCLLDPDGGDYYCAQF